MINVAPTDYVPKFEETYRSVRLSVCRGVMVKNVYSQDF